MPADAAKTMINYSRVSVSEVERAKERAYSDIKLEEASGAAAAAAAGMKRCNNE